MHGIYELFQGIMNMGAPWHMVVLVVLISCTTGVFTSLFKQFRRTGGPSGRSRPSLLPVAIAPDLDILFDSHQTYSHSIGRRPSLVWLPRWLHRGYCSARRCGSGTAWPWA